MERGWFVSRETPSGVLLLKVYAGGEGASVSWRLPPKNSWETSAQPSSFAAFVDIPCAVGFSTPVVKELSSWFTLINGAITNWVFLKYLESEWKYFWEEMYKKSHFSANYWKLQLFITFVQKGRRPICAKKSQWFSHARKAKVNFYGDDKSFEGMFQTFVVAKFFKHFMSSFSFFCRHVRCCQFEQL